MITFTSYLWAFRLDIFWQLIMTAFLKSLTRRIPRKNIVKSILTTRREVENSLMLSAVEMHNDILYMRMVQLEIHKVWFLHWRITTGAM